MTQKKIMIVLGLVVVVALFTLNIVTPTLEAAFKPETDNTEDICIPEKVLEIVSEPNFPKQSWDREYLKCLFE